jgi:hypothetical protein
MSWWPAGRPVWPLIGESIGFYRILHANHYEEFKFFMAPVSNIFRNMPERTAKISTPSILGVLPGSSQLRPFRAFHIINGETLK